MSSSLAVTDAVRAMWLPSLEDEISLVEVDAKARDVVVVFVPADTTQPLTEVKIPQGEGKAIECMVAFCTAHFSKIGALKNAKQLELYRSQVKEHAKGQDIPEDLFMQMSGTTSVDMVVLMPNRPETNWVSVNVYVDDKGVAKHLPSNQRASSICHTAGLGNQQITGDAFIGMQFDNDEGFRRLDFGLKQLGDGGWIKRAQQLNMQARSSANQTDMKKRLQELQQQTVPPKPTPLTEEQQQQRIDEKRRKLAVRNAAKKKDVGNVLFGKAAFQKAADEYTKGLEFLKLADADVSVDSLTDNNVAHALLSNRSACFSKLQSFDDALKDATACVAIKPDWPKAFGRKADALIGLERWEMAEEALKHALSINQAGSTAELDERLAFVETKLK